MRLRALTVTTHLGPHEWMSRHVFVGVAEKIPGANRIHYFVVL